MRRSPFRHRRGGRKEVLVAPDENQVVAFGMQSLGPNQVPIDVPRLDRLDGNEWVKCNADQAFIAIGLRLRPGEEQKFVAAIPPPAPAGRYCLTKLRGWE